VPSSPRRTCAAPAGRARLRLPGRPRPSTRLLLEDAAPQAGYHALYATVIAPYRAADPTPALPISRSRRMATASSAASRQRARLPLRLDCRRARQVAWRPLLPVRRAGERVSMAFILRSNRRQIAHGSDTRWGCAMVRLIVGLAMIGCWPAAPARSRPRACGDPRNRPGCMPSRRTIPGRPARSAPRRGTRLHQYSERRRCLPLRDARLGPRAFVTLSELPFPTRRSSPIGVATSSRASQRPIDGAGRGRASLRLPGSY